MSPAFLADLVVAAHAAYVAYVVVGQAIVLAGVLLRWQWTRNFWFRATHLAAILAVAFEAVLEIECPLTTLENWLRLEAGQPLQGTSFIGRLLHDVLFVELPAGALLCLHLGFAVLVLATFVAAPPRLPRWLKRRSRDPGSAA